MKIVNLKTEVYEISKNNTMTLTQHKHKVTPSSTIVRSIFLMNCQAILIELKLIPEYIQKHSRGNCY